MARNGRTKITADGEVVQDADISRSGGYQLDVFGFNLDIRQFLVVLALASLMLGSRGTIALLIALGAYTAFQRLTRGSGSDRNHGGSGRGGRGGGGGGGGGPRIKGVKDLPCDPKGG